MRHPWPFKIWLPWFHHLPLLPVTCRHECSVVSDSLWPCGLEPARLLCLWDYPGKSTGVGCHFLLQGIFLTQGLNWDLLHCRWILYHWDIGEVPLSPCILAISEHTKLWKIATASRPQWMLFFPTWNSSSPTAPSTGYLLFTLQVSAGKSHFSENPSHHPSNPGEDCCHSSYCRIVWFPVYFSVSPTES